MSKKPLFACRMPDESVSYGKVRSNHLIYEISYARNEKTEEGKNVICTRPFMRVGFKRKWPCTEVWLKIIAEKNKIEGAFKRLKPFSKNLLRPFYTLLRKCKITVTLHGGDPLPCEYDFDRTVRNVCKCLASKYKKPNEFVICQRLEA